jgi:hypothetical protein
MLSVDVHQEKRPECLTDTEAPHIANEPETERIGRMVGESRPDGQRASPENCVGLVDGEAART